MPTGSSASYDWWDTDLSLETATIGATSSITLMRIIRANNGAEINTYSEWGKLIDEGAVPTIDQEYNLGGSWQQYMRCRSISVKKMTGRHIVATMQFSANLASRRIGGSDRLTYAMSTNYGSRLRQMEAWRNNWSSTNSPQTKYVNDRSNDIQGSLGVVSNIDPGGESVTMEVPQVSIRVRLNINASISPVIGALAPLRDLIGKYNAATFYGFPANSVLCEGFNVSQTPGQTEIHEVTIDFLHDSFWFHSQTPDRDPAGRPILQAAGATPAGQGARTVRWVRLTRLTADFNTIFGSNEDKLLAQNGWWS